MKRLLVYIATAVIVLWYRICSLFPTRKRIVCLSRQQNGTTQDFELLRDYFAKHNPDWDVTVLAKTLDNPAAYLFHMIRQVVLIATSRMVVLDSYCIVVSLLRNRIKAPVLQMWHALGNMKKFGYMTLDTPEGRSSETARLLHMHEGYDSVLVSSMSFADDLAAGFNVPVSILYEAPLPRVDLFTDLRIRQRERKRVIQAIPQLANGKKNIVYCPTFRRMPAPNEDEAMRALLGAVDFDHYNFIFKRHPVSTQIISDKRIIQDYPADVDPLYVADYAISDYSTVIYEAGLLDVPIYLYAYDWDTYSNRRSLNIDLEREVPTLFTDNPTVIMDAIDNNRFDAARYRAFVNANVAVPKYTSCTERIVNHIFDMMDNVRF